MAAKRNNWSGKKFGGDSGAEENGAEEKNQSEPNEGQQIDQETPAQIEPNEDETPEIKPVTQSEKKRAESKKEQTTANIRLNKYLAKAGVCSRRDADKIIAAGRVAINGEVTTTLGTKVRSTDLIELDGEELKMEQLRYILLNKPKDSVTTMDDTHDRRTVMDLVKDACEERIYPVGRLDRMTTGVLLLTNDGGLAKRLTHPSHQIKKVYLAQLNQPISQDELNQLCAGVTLEDGPSAFDSAEFDTKDSSGKTVIVTLHSGKNRIVRRMFSHMNYRVEKLDRISFAGLTKGNVTRGKWRFLSEREIGFLKMAK